MSDGYNINRHAFDVEPQSHRPDRRLERRGKITICTCVYLQIDVIDAVQSSLVHNHFGRFLARLKLPRISVKDRTAHHLREHAGKLRHRSAPMELVDSGFINRLFYFFRRHLFQLDATLRHSQNVDRQSLRLGLNRQIEPLRQKTSQHLPELIPGRWTSCPGLDFVTLGVRPRRRTENLRELNIVSFRDHALQSRPLPGKPLAIYRAIEGRLIRLIEFDRRYFEGKCAGGVVQRWVFVPAPEGLARGRGLRSQTRDVALLYCLTSFNQTTEFNQTAD